MRAKFCLNMLCLFGHLIVDSYAIGISEQDTAYLERAEEPVSAVLKKAAHSTCSVIFLMDSKSSQQAGYLLKQLHKQDESPRGSTFFEIGADFVHPNSTLRVMSDIIRQATKLRKSSWCVIVVAASEDFRFLEHLSEVSMKERLVGWSVKMLVISSLSKAHLHRLLSQFWTYSMMSTMFLNLDGDGDGKWKWNIYAFYAYSETGPQVIHLGSFKRGMGLLLQPNRRLFPDKYQNFYGGIVNVTSLTHTPYWMEREYIREDGTIGKEIYGTDGLLLHAVAKTLNFTFYLMPADDWDEVERLVISREAYISPVYWDLIPERLEKHDMSFVYEHAYFAFSMATTPPKPHWSSLYFPLTNDVWLATLISTLLASVALALMLAFKEEKLSDRLIAIGTAFYEILATLLDQNFAAMLPTSASGRILMVGWLTFSFIIGSAYRANLTAHLMKPSKQERAETVEELVQVADVVTGETYSESTKVFFMKSDYLPYKKLGNMLDIGYETSVGMQKAVENKRSSHVDFLKHMHHVLVGKFTKPDGTTSLYIGKSKIVYLPSCWPFSHDTPFMPHVNKVIMMAVESGIIDKWYSDEIDKARRESIRRHREYLKKSQDTAGVDSGDQGGDSGSLTLGHLQGPFMLLGLGVVLGTVTFLVEVFAVKLC